MHHITEDTPPDMLAGAMDLVVRLPDGRDVNMAVERSTPMMDLLVHLTTANKLKPSDHLLQALDMSTDRTLPYKPNTPIGALDTQRVRVYPKGSGKGLAPRVPTGQQPFESTFRLQVHLPRNQFCVIRVGKYVLLEDIMKKVCEEKNLDSKKYEFRHPANIDKVLDPKRTLNDYEITEITVVHRGGHLGQALSSTDIMALQREDERRKMQAKTGGGVLNLIFKRGRNSMGSGSISSDTRSISPTQSDDSRSVTPPAIQPPIIKSPSKESVPSRPKPPQRKRRPAPKPPQITQSKSLPEQTTPEVPEPPKHENGLTICHSRNSSDSSGYHEASILSDNCTTLPRRPKSIGINSSSLNNSNTSMEKSDFRKSTGNLVNMSLQSKSTISLTTAGRKKKAPPPPPLSSANSASSISSPPHSDIVVASKQDEMVPKPKPRTIKAPVPVPTPRRVFSEPPQQLRTNTNEEVEANEEPTRIQQTIFSPKEAVFQKLDTNELEQTNLSPKEDIFVQRASSETNEFETTNSPKEDFVEVVDSFDTNEFETTNSLKEDFVEKVASSDTNEFDNTNSPKEYFDEEVASFDTNGFKTTNSPKEDIVQEITSFDSNSPKEDFIGKVASSDTNEFNTINSLKEDFVEKVASSDTIGFKTTNSPKEEIFEAEALSDTNELKTTNSPNEDIFQAEDLSDTNVSKTTNSPKEEVFEKIASSDTNEDILDFVLEPPIIQQTNENISIDSSQKNSPNFDTLSRTRGFQIGQSMLSIDSTENLRRNISSSTLNSSSSGEDNLSIHIENINIFENKKRPRKKKNSHKTENLVEINDLRHNKTYEEFLTKSPSDLDLPENDSMLSLRSLPGFEDTESKMRKWENLQSLDASFGNRWVVGDPSDADSPDLSTNSKQPSIVSTLSEETPQLISPEKIEAPPSFKEETLPSFKEEAKPQDDLDADWQYTLPSPPTAFRDSSPTNFTDVTNYDTVTFNCLTSNSVITSPALYEKLENITRPETEDDTISESSIKKPIPSEVAKEEIKEEVLTSKYLSLETLEKRKSLVLERELASLKNDEIKSQRDSLKNEIEEVLQNRSRSATLSRTNSQSREKLISSDSILPNFKITTYDQPKNKINIFEDDSIRSSNYEPPKFPKINQNENFFAKRNSMDDFMFKKPEIPPKFIKRIDDTPDAVSRSESFSTNKHIWNRTSPVKRSKSHVSLDKYKEEVTNDESLNLHKSNSLYNVSGLQSLEVMRMILPKLGNTPPNSPSEDKQPSFEKPQNTTPYIPPKPEPTPTPPPTQSSSIPTKTYRYSGPPAINFATWSDRPKTQVSIKEDTDYKFNNIKSKFTSSQSYPSVNIRVNSSKDQVDSGKINIKINEEQPSPQPGNVVIKIGSSTRNPEEVQKNSLYTRFLNQTTAVGYRKPLGNINGVDKPRPHSIAFDSSCPDLSRVPIVRAVELKKPFKETPGNNKSITQILHDTSFPEDDNKNRHSSIYLSNENNVKTDARTTFSPVSRGNSFARNSNPVVKGFLPFTQTLRRTEIPQKPTPTSTNLFEINLRKTSNRHSLPVEVQQQQQQQVPVPPPAPKLPKLFGKKPLQRQLQVNDPRDQLLESIRSFGGKSGLKTVK